MSSTIYSRKTKPVDVLLRAKLIVHSRIPHYYTKEATEAIRPLLGEKYHEDRGNFNAAMWESFHKCQWVKADDVEDEKERAYWFKAGPIPPPESDMKKRAWI
jgi:hypothetical protein